MEEIPKADSVTEHQEIKTLLQRNAELLEENNKMLKHIQTHLWWGLAIKLLWYAILIGLPFILYFYVIEPYFSLFGSDYELFRAGVGELPGIKGIDLIYPSDQ